MAKRFTQSGLPFVASNVQSFPQGPHLLRLQALVAMMSKHNVFVETKHSYGSGMRLDNNLVLTSYHIYEGKSSFKVNRKPALVLQEDEDLDLMLLEVEPAPVHPLSIQTQIRTPDLVVGFGNMRRNHGLVSVGYVMKPTEKRIYIDISIVDGFSGGMLLSASTGALVGVVSGVEGSIEAGQIPYAISGGVVKTFLRKAGYVASDKQSALDLTG